MIGKRFRIGGLVPVVAESAEAALRLIRDGLAPRAILLDLKMPGVGGLASMPTLQVTREHRALVDELMDQNDWHLAGGVATETTPESLHCGSAGL